MSLLRFGRDSFFDDFFSDDFVGMNRRIRNLERSLMPRESSPMTPDVFRAPKVDFKDNGDKYTLVAELPGTNKDDIKIDLDEDNHTLKLSGEKKMEREEENQETKYHYREMSYGRFERTFKLPSDVHLEDIKASMNNGLLSVDIPKVPTKEQEVKPRIRNIGITE